MTAISRYRRLVNEAAMEQAIRDAVAYRQGQKNVINPGFFGKISRTATVLETPPPPLTTRLREQERAVPKSTNSQQREVQPVPEPGSEAFRLLKERLLASIEIEPSGCFAWKKARSKDGYGVVFACGRKWLAHRLAYVVLTGNSLPDGLVADHLCRNRHCINPAHLDFVGQKENVRRGMVPSAISVRMNRCRNGHEFSPENTYTDKRDGKRECIACRRERVRKRRELNEAAA